MLLDNDTVMSHLRIRDLPQSSKPREKLLLKGAKALSDAELIALIIGTGSESENAVSLANRILAAIPLKRLAISMQHLLRIRGIGRAKASALIASFELARRRGQPHEQAVVATPKQVYELVKPLVGGAEQEHFIGIYVNTRKQVIAMHTLFIGTLDAIVVHPREIFAKAMQEHAAGIILVHNHPSGDPSPSDEDIAFTKQLERIAKLMQIEFIDHVIVGDDTYYSFVEKSP
jgi:DNA repair protein RadC